MATTRFCKHGHPLEGDNLGTRTRNGRRLPQCRACRKGWDKAARQRRKLGIPSRRQAVPVLAQANLRKTHCLYGHPYAGDNLYVRPDGKRTCRTCQRARRKAHDRKRRAQAKAAAAEAYRQRIFAKLDARAA